MQDACHLLLYFVRIPKIITINGSHKLAARMFNRTVACSRNSSIWLLNEHDARISLCKLSDYGGCVILGPIINHNNLYILIGLQ